MQPYVRVDAIYLLIKVCTGTSDNQVYHTMSECTIEFAYAAARDSAWSHSWHGRNTEVDQSGWKVQSNGDDFDRRQVEKDVLVSRRYCA